MNDTLKFGIHFQDDKKEESNAITVDSNKEDTAQSLIEADEAKKIVESITYSITGGEKQECN